MPPRGLIISNGAFDTRLAGGDFHFLRLARRLVERGHQVTFLGGHAMAHRRDAFALPVDVLLTDDRLPDLHEHDRIGILRDYARKARRSLRILRDAPVFDYAYATSDLWADIIPLMACCATRKCFILHMRAPLIRECLKPHPLFAGEKRLSSWHYALSQGYSLRHARRSGVDHVFCIRAAFIEHLARFGYDRARCSWMPVGYDMAEIDAAAPVSPPIDVVWIGRAHPQKGIADLLKVLTRLKIAIPDFRAVLIGALKDALSGELVARGLETNVALPGYVSGAAKFGLVKAARVFLLPSYFEGAPAVAGEAVLCGVPVAAYAIEALAEMPTELVHRVPCFDVEALAAKTVALVTAARAGRLTVPEASVREFRAANGLDAAVSAFVRFAE